MFVFVVLPVIRIWLPEGCLFMKYLPKHVHVSLLKPPKPVCRNCEHGLWCFTPAWIHSHCSSHAVRGGWLLYFKNNPWQQIVMLGHLCPKSFTKNRTVQVASLTYHSCPTQLHLSADGFCWSKFTTGCWDPPWQNLACAPWLGFSCAMLI